jgi:hypothetical protein
MIVYHGTSLERAEQIAREGLLPQDKGRFLVDSFWLGGMNSDYTANRTQVHVTPLKDWAVEYAKLRVQYDNAKSGEAVVFGNNSDYVKVAEEKFKATKPVVIWFSLPEDVELKVDEFDSNAYVLPRVEPRAIKKIEEV